LLWKIHKQLTK